MGLLIVMAAAFACTIPSCFIAQRILRKRGREVALLDAPGPFMQVATGPQKALLIGLNFLVAGGAVFLLVKFG
ncbi:MAG: hypothetical protein QM765_30670 [Myxococcales bacterium]